MDRRKAQAAQRIRRHMAALGFPIDDLSDEEVERGVQKVTDVASRTGLSTAEAVTSMRILAGP